MLAAAAALALVGYRGARAGRADLEAARAELTSVSDAPQSLSTADGRAAATAHLDRALTDVQQGRHVLRHNVAFTVARYVPLIARQRRGLLRLVDDAAIAVTTGQHLLGTISASAEGLHARQGVIPLDRVALVSATARSSGEALATLDRSAGGLWNPIHDARVQFDALDRRLADRLLAGSDGLDAARTFLGAAGSRHYFLAVENNAEMRDRGMTLSYGTLTVDHGHLTVGHTGRVAEIALTRPAPAPVPPGTEALFHEIAPAQLWQSTTATPDYAYSGRAMVDMFHQATGQQVDGVVAIDVVALAGLLEVLGPVTVPGVPTAITAQNATTVLLHDLYLADPNTTRIEHLADFAKAVADRLTQGDVDTIRLAKSLSTAAAGGHVKLFSADAAEESAFERSGLAGGPATVKADRTFHFAVESRLAAKVDYFIAPKVEQRVVVARDGSAVVHTTVTVPNGAPRGGPPSELLGPDLSNPYPGQQTGDYIAWVLCWAPAGAAQVDSVPESGLEAAQQIRTLHPGETTTVSFDTTIPHAVRNGRLELRYVPQPRMTAVDLTVTVSSSAWKLSGPRQFQGPMDRTIDLSWGAKAA